MKAIFLITIAIFFTSIGSAENDHQWDELARSECLKNDYDFEIPVEHLQQTCACVANELAEVQFRNVDREALRKMILSIYGSNSEVGGSEGREQLGWEACLGQSEVCAFGSAMGQPIRQCISKVDRGH